VRIVVNLVTTNVKSSSWYHDIYYCVSI